MCDRYGHDKFNEHWMKGLVEWKVVDVFESRRFGGLTTDGNS